MARVKLDDGREITEVGGLQTIGARLLGDHPACGLEGTLFVNPQQMVWFCFGCHARGIVLSIRQIEAV